MESHIPPHEQLSARERFQRIGRQILEACALAGSCWTGMPFDFTETQGYADNGLKEIHAFVNDPKNH